MEKGLSDLTLRCGKGQGMQRSSSSLESPHQSRGTQERRRGGRLRSERSGPSLEDDFRAFSTDSGPIEEPSWTDDDVLKDFDFEAFMFTGSEATDSAWQAESTSETHTGDTRGSHALPSELRSLALDRLRQIEGHFATGEASSSSSSAEAAEAQRRADLVSEWLLWWDESPTACFDDSKDYLAHDQQRAYSEAWENHVQHKVEARSHWQKNDTPILQPAPSRAIQRITFERQGAGSSVCPNKKSHKDVAASGRSTPVAAQHRACPHAGCGYCSTTSTAWFEHVRSCAA